MGPRKLKDLETKLTIERNDLQARIYLTEDVEELSKLKADLEVIDQELTSVRLNLFKDGQLK